MRFAVRGIEIDSGRELAFDIDATDRDDAIAKLGYRRIAWDSIEPAPPAVPQPKINAVAYAQPTTPGVATGSAGERRSRDRRNPTLALLTGGIILLALASLVAVLIGIKGKASTPRPAGEVMHTSMPTGVLSVHYADDDSMSAFMATDEATTTTLISVKNKTDEVVVVTGGAIGGLPMRPFSRDMMQEMPIGVPRSVLPNESIDFQLVGRSADMPDSEWIITLLTQSGTRTLTRTAIPKGHTN